LKHLGSISWNPIAVRFIIKHPGGTGNEQE